MANTYSWDCKTVDIYPTHDSLSDVVYNVHWRYTATDESGEHSATLIGTQIISLDDIDPETFVIFEDLTNDILTGWVQTAIGDEGLQTMKENADTQVSNLITPTSITKTIQ
jgi:hypothetical protein